MNAKEFFAKCEWSENPFNFSINPNLAVEQQKYYTRLKLFLDSGDKLALVIGNTGMGKTTLLRRFCLENFHVAYLPRPPKSEVELFKFIKANFVNFPSRLFITINSYNKLNKFLKKNRVIIIDEIHESPPEVLSYIQTLIDNVNNLSFIFAGLTEFLDLLKKEHETLFSRLSEVLEIEPLSRTGVLEMITLRIRSVNGKGIEPFTSEAVSEIHEISRGIPREVLRICNNAVKKAIIDDRSIIDKSFIKRIYNSSNGQFTDFSQYKPPDLTDKQANIAAALEKLGNATPTQLSDTLLSEYPSRSHALRAINNILKRMLEMGVVERKKKGRTYVYSVKKEEKYA